MSETFTHRPVLLEECIQGLAIRPDGLYIDGTLGRGGHSKEIVKRLTQGGRLICIDRDSQAIEAGKARLAPWAEQITFLHGNFGDLAQLLDGAGIGKADGMLFDLGVSSPQLDDPERGFSYMHDAPLDMRMDRDDALTAWTVVNQWPRTELRRILSQYGEEKYAGSIAAAIERAHLEAPAIGWREAAIGAAIGLFAGLASGYVGVGGGFIMVPLMMSVLHVPMKLTSGTSLIAVMILAVPGTITQAVLGNINWVAGIAVACGSIPGAALGAKLIPKVPERQLRFLFAGFLVVAAVLLVVNQLGVWG